jgi:outer membrane immunogenic protein
MKKLLLSSFALLGLSAGAFAADLPRRAAPVFAPVPVFTWTGFYVGVNAGYGWADDNDDNFGFLNNGLITPTSPVTVAAVVPAAGTFFPGTGVATGNGSRDGFLGGAQIGFNYQFTPGSGFVVGIEADIQWADLGGRNNNNAFFGNGFGTAIPTIPNAPGFGIAPGVPNVAFFNNGAFGSGNNGNGDWFATVRGRVGYAFDRVLVYATGGLAFTDRGNDNVFVGGINTGGALPAAFFTGPLAATAALGVVGTNNGLFGRRNSDDFGWTVGGGIEYAVTNNISIKLEGLYVNFDNGNGNGAFVGNGVVGVTNQGAPIIATGNGFGRRNHDNDFALVRAGVNFRFWGM